MADLPKHENSASKLEIVGALRDLDREIEALASWKDAPDTETLFAAAARLSELEEQRDRLRKRLKEIDADASRAAKHAVGGGLTAESRGMIGRWWWG